MILQYLQNVFRIGADPLETVMKDQVLVPSPYCPMENILLDHKEEVMDL